MMLGQEKIKQAGVELPWPDNYYAVTDRLTRKEILDAAIKEQGRTNENDIRLLLWNKRYPKGKEEVDYFIRFWIDMCYVSKNYKSFFTKKSCLKMVDKGMQEVGFTLEEVKTKVGSELLEAELCHMIRLYLRLCTEDRSYTSSLLGLMSLKDDKLKDKIVNEVYRVAVKMPEEIGMKEELALFTSAALSAFYQDFPDLKEHMLYLISQEES